MSRLVLVRHEIGCVGDQVRVRGKSKDDLQAAMRLLRDAPLEIDMQFTNYR